MHAKHIMLEHHAQFAAAAICLKTLMHHLLMTHAALNNLRQLLPVVALKYSTGQEMTFDDMC